MSGTRPAAARLEWKEALAIALAALIWFLPGIGWGLPSLTATTQTGRWGVDELGPFGALNAVRAMLGSDPSLSPQYPLGQYWIQALLVWPYHLAVLAADNLGFPPQTESVTVLSLLHRLPSLLMAAATVAMAAAFTGQVTGSRVASWFTAACVACIGPLVYYARTSNVDAGALFWVMLGLLVALQVVKDGLQVRPAALLGLCAAAGIATKDQQYAVFLGMAVVLLITHAKAAAAGTPASTRWRGPLAGLAVATGCYLLVSGALILPHWFAGHVAFIRSGSAQTLPAELLPLVNTYFSNPATLMGYAHLARDAAQQLASAMGLPLIGLALAGAVLLARRSGRVFALLIVPSLALVAGVILPVRFVLPRFLLPIDLMLCLLAGIALASALSSARWRAVGQVLAVAGLGWGILRSVDFTWQMHADSREAAAAWLEGKLQPGDTLGYYGARFKLPRLPRELVVTPAPGQYLPAEVYGAAGPMTETPQFIIVIPQLVSELAHEWNVPESVFQGLMDGSLGYTQVLAIQTPAIFPRPRLIAPAVNPPVRLFARNDLAPRMSPARVMLAAPPHPDDAP